MSDRKSPQTYSDIAHLIQTLFTQSRKFNLNSFVTKASLTDAKADWDKWRSNLQSEVSNIVSTTDEVRQRLPDILAINPDNYARKTDLSSYATTTTLSSYALKGDVDSSLQKMEAQISSSAQQLQEKYDPIVQQQKSTASEVSNLTESLSNYTLKSDVVEDVTPAITAAVSAAIAQEVSDRDAAIKNSIPPEPNLSGYLQKADLGQYATESAIQNAINQLNADIQQTTSQISPLSQQVTQNKENIQKLSSSSSSGSSSGSETIPVGMVGMFASETPPENWLIRDGSKFDTVKYPKLAALYPSGVLPDDRGLFLRGYDPISSRDPQGGSRGFASYQEGSVGGGSSNISGRFGIPFYWNGQNLYTGNLETPDPNYYPKDPSVCNPFSNNSLFIDIHSLSANDQAWAQVGISRPKNRNYLPIIYAGTPSQ